MFDAPSHIIDIHDNNDADDKDNFNDNLNIYGMFGYNVAKENKQFTRNLIESLIDDNTITLPMDVIDLIHVYYDEHDCRAYICHMLPQYQQKYKRVINLLVYYQGLICVELFKWRSKFKLTCLSITWCIVCYTCIILQTIYSSIAWNGILE